MDIRLSGYANDYVGKGMNGGTIVVSDIYHNSIITPLISPLSYHPLISPFNIDL